MSLKVATRHLGKSFGDFAAVSDVSLAFEPGLIHAVLGENGAGKSTLMKLLFGLHAPTSGEILVNDEPVRWRSPLGAIAAGFGMVQQHFTLVEPLSAIDNIMLGAEIESWGGRLDRAKAIQKIDSVLPSQSLRVSWEKPVQAMTVGEKQRVEILKLLFRDSKILFLDEPTAVLAPSEIQEFFDVLRALKAQGRTIVLITHKINEVLSVCDTYSILRQGRLIATGQTRETTADTIVEKMIGRAMDAFDFPRPDSSQAPFALKANNLNGIDLDLRCGEIVGIAGVEGSGQSIFVDSVLGLRNFSGHLEIFDQEVFPGETKRIRDLKVGLIPEDRHSQGLWLERSCHDNMIIGLEPRFSEYGILDRTEIEKTTSRWADGYDVRSESLRVPVGSLSGGNQQKILFAREVSGRDPRLLICHQPTRGVDLGAMDLIHRKLMELRNAGRAILVLSSELDELLKLSDRLVVFFNGQVSGRFERSAFDPVQIGAAMTGVQA